MLPHQIDLVCLYASLFCYVLFYFILCFAVCMFYTVLFLFYFLLFYVCLLFSLAFLSLFSAHSPDNSFVGFAVPDKKHLVETKVTRIGTKALVYGKMPFFWEVRETHKFICNEIKVLYQTSDDEVRSQKSLCISLISLSL